MATNLDKTGADLSPEAASEMSDYGIACVPLNYYHVGPYRYTNRDDAIAEAKRRQIRG